MARYRMALRRLNRSIKCAGDRGGYDSFYMTGERALQHALRTLRQDKTDKRTSEGKQIVAAIERLETLRRELLRYLPQQSSS